MFEQINATFVSDEIQFRIQSTNRSFVYELNSAHRIDIASDDIIAILLLFVIIFFRWTSRVGLPFAVDILHPTLVHSVKRHQNRIRMHSFFPSKLSGMSPYMTLALDSFICEFIPCRFVLFENSVFLCIFRTIKNLYCIFVNFSIIKTGKL